MKFTEWCVALLLAAVWCAVAGVFLFIDWLAGPPPRGRPQR